MFDDDFKFANKNFKKVCPEGNVYDALVLYNNVSKNAEKGFYAKPIYNEQAWMEMIELSIASRNNK